MAGKTQTLSSDWGREPLTVAAEIPTVALRYMLGQVHCMTPDDEIERMVTEKIDRANSHGCAPVYSEAQRAETIAAALWIHAEDRALYVGVMSGHF